MTENFHSECVSTVVDMPLQTPGDWGVTGHYLLRDIICASLLSISVNTQLYSSLQFNYRYHYNLNTMLYDVKRGEVWKCFPAGADVVILFISACIIPCFYVEAQYSTISGNIFVSFELRESRHHHNTVSVTEVSGQGWRLEHVLCQLYRGIL